MTTAEVLAIIGVGGMGVAVARRMGAGRVIVLGDVNAAQVESVAQQLSDDGHQVVIGHVDSTSGPGVFFHLRALRRGDRITVVLRDRRRVRFVVTGSQEAPKLRFPTQAVFRRTERPTLRLVTCGGRFDRSTHHYVDNYIVFAHLDGV